MLSFNPEHQLCCGVWKNISVISVNFRWIEEVPQYFSDFKSTNKQLTIETLSECQLIVICLKGVLSTPWNSCLFKRLPSNAAGTPVLLPPGCWVFKDRSKARSNMTKCVVMMEKPINLFLNKRLWWFTTIIYTTEKTSYSEVSKIRLWPFPSNYNYIFSFHNLFSGVPRKKNYLYYLHI